MKIKNALNRVRFVLLLLIAHKRVGAELPIASGRIIALAFYRFKSCQGD